MTAFGKKTLKWLVNGPSVAAVIIRRSCPISFFQSDLDRRTEMASRQKISSPATQNYWTLAYARKISPETW